MPKALPGTVPIKFMHPTHVHAVAQTQILEIKAMMDRNTGELTRAVLKTVI